MFKSEIYEHTKLKFIYENKKLYFVNSCYLAIE